ncbi:MAG TPA: phospholipase D-like domain-containing protein [Polyangiaceae bacterium]|nr:phospholipase D-like domain-containing protein [Polyangiaceae bacterium]
MPPSSRLKLMPKQRVPLRFRKVKTRFVPGNAVALLRDGREAFPAMLEAIAAARQQVLLEMYWFDSDRIGRLFAAELGRACQRGVEVAVIYDSIGSIGTDPAMWAELEAQGVHLLEYNPVAPWRRRFRLSFTRLSRRDHRKILVVDGAVGFTGGINLANQWAPVEEEGGGWRDDMMRIAGPAVDGLARCFHRVWRRHQLPALARLPSPASPSGAGRLLPVRILGERYFRHRHAIARDYASRLYAAKKTAYISNSYFVPDGSVRRALVSAARRGVDVRVIVPAHSDVEAVKFAGRAQYGRLLAAGVRIYEWQEGMFHSKTAVIDSHWCTTGTFNFDYMSVRRNLEVNASVLDAELAAQVEASFREDLKGTREVSAQELQFRPLGERLLEAGFYRMRKWL